MEKVLTGRGLRLAMVATTELESTPPLRKAPSGTSLTMCRRTDSFSRSRNSSTSSASLRRSSGAHSTSQYRETRTPRAEAVSTVPGSSFRTPCTMLSACGVVRNVNRWPSAVQLMVRSTSGSCRRAFSSEAKARRPPPCQ